jgi:hypothetical protein
MPRGETSETYILVLLKYLLPPSDLSRIDI